MRIGVVSDIHCNHLGLQAALAAIGDVDELLCLGDSIFEYEFSNEVIALLRDRGAHMILGNHEEVFLSAAGERARASDRVDRSLLGFLADQPHRRSLTLGGRRLLLVHSTPWEPRGTYVYPHSAQLARFADSEADVVLYGHTHAQVVRRVGGVLVINPGSAGDARDSRNGRQLSCAVLDTVTEDVQIIDYPDPRYEAPR
jgi:putative phosphoesterase